MSRSDRQQVRCIGTHIPSLTALSLPAPSLPRPVRRSSGRGMILRQEVVLCPVPCQIDDPLRNRTRRLRTSRVALLTHRLHALVYQCTPRTRPMRSNHLPRTLQIRTRVTSTRGSGTRGRATISTSIGDVTVCNIVGMGRAGAGDAPGEHGHARVEGRIGALAVRAEVGDAAKNAVPHQHNGAVALAAQIPAVHL
jgi:hypothetical protein